MGLSSSTAVHINPHDRLLSLREAADCGHGAPSTLRRDIAASTLHAVKIGNQLKVRLSDLQARAVPARTASLENVEAAAERLAASAPPLSDAQIRRLGAIFGGAS